MASMTTSLSRLARVLWAGPWTLLGLLLSVFFDRRQVSRGVIVAQGASWPGRLGWRYRAITFGHVVLAVDEMDERVFSHELAHVRQYERWGPLLVPAYLVAALLALIRGGHPYRDNPFEIAAEASVRSTSA